MHVKVVAVPVDGNRKRLARRRSREVLVFAPRLVDASPLRLSVHDPRYKGWWPLSIRGEGETRHYYFERSSGGYRIEGAAAARVTDLIAALEDR